jgi:hypothetical protein
MSVESVLKFVHDAVLSGEDSVQMLRESAPSSLAFYHFSDLATDGSKHFPWLCMSNPPQNAVSLWSRCMAIFIVPLQCPLSLRVGACLDEGFHCRNPLLHRPTLHCILIAWPQTLHGCRYAAHPQVDFDSVANSIWYIQYAPACSYITCTHVYVIVKV